MDTFRTHCPFFCASGTMSTHYSRVLGLHLVSLDAAVVDMFHVMCIYSYLVRWFILFRVGNVSYFFYISFEGGGSVLFLLWEGGNCDEGHLGIT